MQPTSGVITPNTVLKKLRRKLGISNEYIPVKDEQIMEIIVQDTIPTFSIYFPNYTIIEINPVADLVPGETDTYYIDTDMFEANGIAVLGVNMRFGSNERRRNDDSMRYMGVGIEGLMNAQMQSDLMSAFETGVVWDFLPPNKVRVSNAMHYTNAIRLELSITHAPNMKTISPTKFESFMDLAILDAKISLWQELKHYDSMETPFGTINLKIDDWANAADDRKTLLERWDELYIMDAKTNIWVV